METASRIAKLKCASCRGEIEHIDHGWVEWLFSPYSNMAARLQIVHSIQGGPRVGQRGGCSDIQEWADAGDMVMDHHLRAFAGPDAADPWQPGGIFCDYEWGDFQHTKRVLARAWKRFGLPAYLGPKPEDERLAAAVRYAAERRFDRGPGLAIYDATQEFRGISKHAIAHFLSMRSNFADSRR